MTKFQKLWTGPIFVSLTEYVIRCADTCGNDLPFNIFNMLFFEFKIFEHINQTVG